MPPHYPPLMFEGVISHRFFSIFAGYILNYRPDPNFARKPFDMPD
jgi:hypothetical protein